MLLKLVAHCIDYEAFWIFKTSLASYYLIIGKLFNPLTPISDQDRISPYNINQIGDENKEKYQFGDN